MIFIYRGLLAALWLGAAYKWGDWKNWSKYYPTMLFMGMGNLIYFYIFHDKLLWWYNYGNLNGIFTELFIIFSVFSCTVLIYLTHLPQKFLKKVWYITIWVAIYMIIEIFALNKGMEFLGNGWNLWWSLLHNYYQFPLLAIHHKKPYLAWLIAIIIMTIMMGIFGIPLTNIE